MKEKERDYRDYLNDIFEEITNIMDFVRGFEYEDFVRDKKTINAVIRSIEVIGEAAKNMPADFKEKYNDIPWKDIAGMRDKLIHEYFGVDLEIVWKVVVDDIPLLKEKIERILEEEK